MWPTVGFCDGFVSGWVDLPVDEIPRTAQSGSKCLVL